MALPEEVKELALRVRNWGRWGDQDEIGTINFITAAVVAKAAQEIQTGKRVSLAIPLDSAGPQIGIISGRVNPVLEMTMVDVPFTGDPADFCSSDDRVTMGLQAGTHWDALAHVSYEGHLYNGVPSNTITNSGALRMGIDRVEYLVGRGVLLDIAKTKGVNRIDGGYALTPQDLDEACEFGNVKLCSGDVVLIRTGHIQHFLAGDRESYGMSAAGPSLQTVEWFYEHEIAAVAIDNAIGEVFPCERDDAMLPVHMIHLVDMGLTQGQNWNLEELSYDCATDGKYSFFLDASPLPFTGAVGSPVNPIAIK